MQSLENVRERCRAVGQSIEKTVAEGGDLLAAFEGVQSVFFKVARDGDGLHVVGGEIGPDDSNLTIAESGVRGQWMDEATGYVFGGETRRAMVDFFATLFHD